jgi:exodeoxyribonuclease VII large subunit
MQALQLLVLVFKTVKILHNVIMNDNSSSFVEKSLTSLEINQGTQILSVSEISLLLKRKVEETFGRIRIRGEISGFKRAPSGHLYFSLKDNTALISGVCWRGNANRLSIKPEDGLEVIVTGRLTTYPARSNYQIVTEEIEIAGEGAILKLLEDRRRKLAKEGLFDLDTKKPLPFLPDIIGVITSETGAVFHDILHRLYDRFPRRVILWPVTVQGEAAADEITAAIEGFNSLIHKEGAKKNHTVSCPDVIIIARGGGSLEDLMAFNEEKVVRAAAASYIPLISAIGHETDTTLIDYASDKRAPTPTAAAEMIVPVRTEIIVQIEDSSTRLFNAISRFIKSEKREIQALARALPDLKRLIESFNQRLDDWTERLTNSIHVCLKSQHAELDQVAAQIPKPKQQIENAKRQLNREVRALKITGLSIIPEHQNNLQQTIALLESFSYQRVLERGFALVTEKNKKPIDSVSSLSEGMPVSIQFQDGNADASIDGSSPNIKKKVYKKNTGEDDSQGTLL